jgi:RNA polymerase sigma-70 factor (ECF subfamily)
VELEVHDAEEALQVFAMTDSSDRSLLMRIGRGEEDAATELYLRYARRLVQLARAQTPADVATRVDPEDIVQSVFRTFFRRAATGAYDIPEGDQLWKLLLVISLNKVRSICSFHRADRRNIGTTVPIGSAIHAFESASQVDEPAFAILEWTIQELLAQQPEIYAKVVRLRIEGCDVAEIARRTRRSKRTVERVLQEFRRKLANVIREECPEVESEDSDSG